jgi:hypothetical protein
MIPGEKRWDKRVRVAEKHVVDTVLLYTRTISETKERAARTLEDPKVTFNEVDKLTAELVAKLFADASKVRDARHQRTIEKRTATRERRRS